MKKKEKNSEPGGLTRRSSLRLPLGRLLLAQSENRHKLISTLSLDYIPRFVFVCFFPFSGLEGTSTLFQISLPKPPPKHL